MSLLESQVDCDPRKKNSCFFISMKSSSQISIHAYLNLIRSPPIYHIGLFNMLYIHLCSCFVKKRSVNMIFWWLKKLHSFFSAYPRKNRIQTTLILVSRAYSPRWHTQLSLSMQRFRVSGPILVLSWVTVVYLRELKFLPFFFLVMIFSTSRRTLRRCKWDVWNASFSRSDFALPIYICSSEL